MGLVGPERKRDRLGGVPMAAALLASLTPRLVAAQAAPKPAASAKAPAAVSEVVVTAKKPPEPGAVVGDIKPEIQLQPEDIQSYGVSTVTELLDEIAPQTRSDRGRGGETPVVLINGRRISSFFEVRDIPVEAILRVDILPEEAALKYGYSANQRVVNIVLRPFFRAVTAEVSGGAASEGGRASGQAQLDFFRVQRENRLNLDLKYSQADDLTQAERSLTADTPLVPYDRGGNVTSTMAGTEIDPRLSALAGRPVTVAGVPAGTGDRPLTLGDFAATAGTARATDTTPYRTLLPGTRNISANAVLTRGVLGGVSATVNAVLEANTSDSELGLPGVSLTVPAGNAFSPFASAVTVDRYVDALGPLKQSVEGWNAHLGTTLNKDRGEWRLSLTGAYDHADSFTLSDVGFNAAPLQAQIITPGSSVDPFGTLPGSLLAFLPQTKARQLTDGANLQALANGPLLAVPAGNLFASIKVGDTESLIDSNSLRFGTAQSVSLSRNDFNAQLNLDLPIASRSRKVLAWAGDLSLNFNAAIDALSDFGVLKTLGYGVNWTPLTGVNLIVSETHDEAAPTTAQLAGPLVVTANAQLFDYVTGSNVQVTRLDGGNRALISDGRDVMKVGVTWKPLADRDLTLQANWIDSRIKNPIATFPATTAEIEAAFPDRFTRDASGNLTQVDNRPVNFAQQDRQELRYGLNFSMPIGPQPPPRRFGGAGGRFGGAAGGRGALGRAGQGLDAGGQPPAQPPPAQPGADADRSGTARPQQPAADDDEGGGPPGQGFGGRGGGGRGGGGGGFGGGGRGGGGRGGGGGGGRLQFAIYHTVFFKDQILVRAGGPTFDLLNGSAAGSTGGQPRHEIEAQAGFTLMGFGARLSADWKSGTTVRGGEGSTTGDLSFSDLATVNLRLFDTFSQQPWAIQRWPWLRGARATFAIVNLFDQRIDVRDARGVTPVSYQPAFLDPAGRTIRLSFRKLFF